MCEKRIIFNANWKCLLSQTTLLIFTMNLLLVHYNISQSVYLYHVCSILVLWTLEFDWKMPLLTTLHIFESNIVILKTQTETCKTFYISIHVTLVSEHCPNYNFLLLRLLSRTNTVWSHKHHSQFRFLGVPNQLPTARNTVIKKIPLPVTHTHKIHKKSGNIRNSNIYFVRHYISVLYFDLAFI